MSQTQVLGRAGAVSFRETLFNVPRIRTSAIESLPPAFGVCPRSRFSAVVILLTTSARVAWGDCSSSTRAASFHQKQLRTTAFVSKRCLSQEVFEAAATTASRNPRDFSCRIVCRVIFLIDINFNYLVLESVGLWRTESRQSVLRIPRIMQNKQNNHNSLLVQI
jgi:hypothetical protein